MFIAPPLPPSYLLLRQVALGWKGGVVVHWGVPPATGRGGERYAEVRGGGGTS